MSLICSLWFLRFGEEATTFVTPQLSITTTTASQLHLFYIHRIELLQSPHPASINVTNVAWQF